MSHGQMYDSKAYDGGKTLCNTCGFSPDQCGECPLFYQHISAIN